MTIPESKIVQCTAKPITDSRGQSTIEVEIVAEYGREEIRAKASVPSGKSIGSEEAFEMKDSDGGVFAAIENVEKKIAPRLLDKTVDSENADHIMLSLDITIDKKYIGANAMLGVSMAMMRLEAKVKNIPLWKLISEKSRFPVGKPLLFMNTFSGGVHADFRLPFQEYILAVGGETIAATNEKAKAIFESVRKKLDEKRIDYYMGDEGGFAPRFENMEEPFQILTDCIANDENIFIGIDAAASEFYRKENDKYEISGEKISRGDLLMIYKGLTEKFKLRSIEDPFSEKDLGGFEESVRWLGGTTLIVGDDLTVTNPILIKKYGLRALATGVIIKPNQIGTMYETFEAIREARNFNWKIIVSNRFAETFDTFISDLAVGVGAYAIKAGAHTQPERAAKYDRLVEIEKEIYVFEEAEKIKKAEKEKARRSMKYY